jgi:hypothetical protein
VGGAIGNPFLWITGVIGILLAVFVRVPEPRPAGSRNEA